MGKSAFISVYNECVCLRHMFSQDKEIDKRKHREREREKERKLEREILPVFDVSLSVDRADLFIASFAFFIVFDLSDAQISSTLGLPILSSKRRRREGDSSRRLETPPRRKFEEDDKKRGREYRSFPPLSPLLYTPSLLRSRLRSNLEPLSVTSLSLSLVF